MPKGFAHRRAWIYNWPDRVTELRKLLSPSAMKIRVESGLGCYAERLPENERTQTLVPDQFRHEIATAFNLKGKGPVMLTSCNTGTRFVFS